MALANQVFVRFWTKVFVTGDDGPLNWGPRFHLSILNIYINRIQKFWGHMLRRHSNPTRNKVWWPWQTKFLVSIGLYTVFLGFWLVLMSFYRFLMVFLEVVAKLLHSKLDFVDIFFWSETSSKPGYLIARPVFFRDLVYIYIYVCIYIYMYIYIYIHTHTHTHTYTYTYTYTYT